MKITIGELIFEHEKFDPTPYKYASGPQSWHAEERAKLVTEFLAFAATKYPPDVPTRTTKDEF